MSRPTRNAAKATFTIWPVDKSASDYSGYGGGTSFGQPYTVKACFNQGGSKQYSDTQGVLFTPATTIWYELPSQGIAKLGDYIAHGNHSSQPDPTELPFAESVRVAQLQDCSLLNDIDDVMVLT